MQSFTEIVDQSFATRRLTEILLTAFAVLAVTLAAVGIYGVMSLHVANRTREFGIRMAIGAEPSALVRLVLREGALLAGQECSSACSARSVRHAGFRVYSTT